MALSYISFIFFWLSAPEGLSALNLFTCLKIFLALNKVALIYDTGEWLEGLHSLFVKESSLIILFEGLQFDPLNIVFATSGKWDNYEIEWNLTLVELIIPIGNSLNDLSNTIITGDESEVMAVTIKAFMTMISICSLN